MKYYSYEWKKVNIPENHLDAKNRCWFFFEIQSQWIYLPYEYITTCSARFYMPFYAMPFDFSLVTDDPIPDKIIQCLNLAGKHKKFDLRDVFQMVNTFSSNHTYQHEITRSFWILGERGKMKIESGKIFLVNEENDE